MQNIKLNFCGERERDLLLAKMHNARRNKELLFLEKNLGAGWKLYYFRGVMEFINEAYWGLFEMRLKNFHFSKTPKADGIKILDLEKSLFCMVFEQPLYDFVMLYTFRDKEVVVHHGDYYQLTYSECATRLAAIQMAFPRVMTTSKTLAHIKENGASLVRFGDGEFNLCLGRHIGFQTWSEALQSRLREILTAPKTDKLLVAIPEYNSRTNNKRNCIGELSFWEHYWYKTFDVVRPLLVHGEYGNANVSRNSVFEENTLDEVKSLWEGRDIVFVYGSGSRFKCEGPLFDNVASKTVIETLAVNAFDDYERLLKACLSEPLDKMFLIACGPTATVLSYDLCQAGYQSLDIGHLPNCYDQYLGEIEAPERLPMTNG